MILVEVKWKKKMTVVPTHPVANASTITTVSALLKPLPIDKCIKKTIIPEKNPTSELFWNKKAGKAEVGSLFVGFYRKYSLLIPHSCIRSQF